MNYFLKIKQGEDDGFEPDEIVLNYGNNEASRGATIAGLGVVRGQVELEAWDEDEGKIWVKEV